MNKLTKEAKAYCHAVLEARGRDAVVQELEAIGIACYDEEDLDELVPAAVDGVEAGDIEFDWSHSAAQAMGHMYYMLWLHIDEVWEGS